MPFSKPLRAGVALLLASLAMPNIASAGISDLIMGTKAGADKQAQESKPTAINAAPATGKDSDVPEWLRDSERIEKMLGADANFRVENPKVIRKVESPVPGLVGYVVEATSFTDENPEGKKELYVFYTDKSRRYLMVGMMIDMRKNRDINLDIERHVRGELADNPAKALRPQDMHAIDIPGKGKSSPLTFVVDLGPQAGKDSFLNVVRLHTSLLKSEAHVRGLRVVLVSAGHDEYSTAAMAIAYGSEVLTSDGIGKLVEFAEKGKSASYLSPKRLAKDSSAKKILGTGIFKMEDNSSQALLAKLDTLPLLYDGQGARMKNVPLPTNQADWRALLTKK